MHIPTTSRRNFLKAGFLGIGGVFMLPSCLKNYTPWQFFTGGEAACVVALCEQIIPADEHGPGATYAGVIFYIDKQLTGVFSGSRQEYREGIRALQASSNQLHGRNFEALDFEVQKEFLTALESGLLPPGPWEGKPDQAGFFKMVVRHTMQGFYGSPRHGGNRNYISYQLMDLDYPYIVGQNRYRNTAKKIIQHK